MIHLMVAIFFTMTALYSTACLFYAATVRDSFKEYALNLLLLLAHSSLAAMFLDSYIKGLL